jgi:hypothetical protein
MDGPRAADTGVTLPKVILDITRISRVSDAISGHVSLLQNLSRPTGFQFASREIPPI